MSILKSKINQNLFYSIIICFMNIFLQFIFSTIHLYYLFSKNIYFYNLEEGIELRALFEHKMREIFKKKEKFII